MGIRRPIGSPGPVALPELPFKKSTRFLISGIEKISACFLQYLFFDIYYVIMSHLSDGFHGTSE